MVIGGPRHPGGTMAEMLAHPDWVPSHLLTLAGFVSLLVGLILYQRSVVLPDRTRRWVGFAVIGTALQAVEMALHTAASIDQQNLVAGRATPVLTTHLWLAVVLYPIFGVTLVGLIIAGVRDRVLGSVWIAWMGIVGALGHASAAPLVVLLQAEWARNLFPLLALFALWTLLAGLWPIRVEPVRSSGKAPMPV
jgi:hypothetical protein